MQRASADATRCQHSAAWNDSGSLSWTCDVSKIRQSMHIYLKNNPATFRPNRSWYDKALDFLKRVAITRRTTTRLVAIWAQFLFQQLRICYRSGTGILCYIGARQTLCVHSPDGGTFLREMTSWSPSWKYDVVLKNLTPSILEEHSCQISSRPDLKRRRLFEEGRPTRTRWVAICDQFLIQNRK